MAPLHIMLHCTGNTYDVFVVVYIGIETSHSYWFSPMYTRNNNNNNNPRLLCMMNPVSLVKARWKVVKPATKVGGVA